AALQERPKVFDSVGVNLSVNVFFSMIDYVVDVAAAIIKTVIGGPAIGEHFRASANIPLNSLVQSILIRFADDLRSDFAASFKQAHDRDFADSATTLNPLLSFPLVHIPRLAANIG